MCDEKPPPQTTIFHQHAYVTTAYFERNSSLVAKEVINSFFNSVCVSKKVLLAILLSFLGV